MKFLFPTILIVVSIGLFVAFINPTYSDTKDLKAQADSYSQALDNSKKLQTVRDALVTKYNSFSPDTLDRLKKLLPDNVDNIKLILEIDRMAGQYGMQLKNIKYDLLNEQTSAQTRAQFAENTQASKDYNDFSLEFSIEGTYTNFVSFLESIERSLRVVDIQSIAFTVSDVSGITPGISSDIYKFDLKVKTYWLKK